MMRFVLLILFSTLLFGCSDKPKDADLALQEKSALNVLEEHSEASYQAPANGILDDEQVQMYIAVKKREIELAAAAAKKIEQREAKVAKPEQGSLGGMMEDLSALSDFASFVTGAITRLNTNGFVMSFGRLQ